MKFIQNKGGFTLVELLLVVAIIGVVLTIATVSFQEARTRGRDTQRVASLGEINKALNLYLANNGSFPVATTPVSLTGSDAVSLALKGDLVIPEVPADPQHPTFTYDYQTDVAGTTFVLLFCLETDSIPNYAQGCGNQITP